MFGNLYKAADKKEKKAKKEKKDKKEKRRRDDGDGDEPGAGIAADRHAGAPPPQAAHHQQHDTRREMHEPRDTHYDEAPVRVATAHGYTDEQNPFGDQNLTETFQWGKKKEADHKAGRSTTQNDALGDAERRRAQMDEEIRKVKRRREEREAQQAMWDAEKQRMLADQDGLTVEEWEERGLQFELDQLVQRAKNRLQEKRLKPIDALIFTLRTLRGLEEPSLLGGDIREPSRLISGLSIRDLKELATDIEDLVRYDSPNRDLWEAMQHVVGAELQEQLKGAAASQAGVHRLVQTDVNKEFASKTLAELDAAEAQIKAQVAQGGTLDMEFWDSLLQQMGLWKSKAVLREFYKEKMSSLLGEGAADVLQSQEASKPTSRPRVCTEGSDDEEDLGMRRPAGPLSPALRPLDTMTDEEIDKLIGEADDVRDMWRKRSSQFIAGDAQDEQEELLVRSGQKLGEGENLFDDQVQVRASYSWHDKYRPRKPKYFNRVRTGFEWTKYNSTHYDADNPPPKRVLGYKFNVFYPDLASASQQPVYFKEPTEKGWNDDVCILRFSAGPPYEDIAFTIVNKEWDKHWRAGYQCKFERGVLHLHFQFMRYRYRR